MWCQQSYINPAYHEQVAGAVQTDDIREFIDEGVIYARPIQEPLGTEQISVLSKSVREEEKVKVQERVLQMQEIQERTDG